MNSECRRYLYPTFLCVLFAAILSLAGCTNPEKAKAEHVNKGESYLKDSKFQEASLEFRNALQIDGNLAAAHWGLARAFEGLQRYPEMFGELQKTVELDANNLDARNRLGNYYLAGGKGKTEYIDAADKLAQEVLAKDPGNIEGHILMGSVLFSRNERDKAFAELNHAIELDPKRVESYLSLSRYYVVTKDFGKAEETLKRAISVNPNSPLSHTEYGRYLVQVNRLPEAEVEINKAVEVGPNDRTARFMLASFYLVTKQNDKAEQAYKALAALDPDKPESQAILGDFYAQTQRTDEALKIYKDILAKSPDYAQGRYRLTEILLMKNDSAGATAEVDDALKKDPSDRQALMLRARIKAQTGREDGLKAAIEDLKEVLKQEPTSRPGLYFMAQTTYQLGQIDQARVFAADLEKNYPDYLPAKLMKLQIALGSGDQKETISLANDLLDRLTRTAADRDNSAALLTELKERTLIARGTAQMQLNNVTAAKQDFTAAHDTAPNDPTTYNTLAGIAVYEKKPEDAINYWESALRIDGSNFAALNGITSLYSQTGEPAKAHARIDQALGTYPNNPGLHFLKGQIFAGEHNLQSAEAELRKSIELDKNFIAAYNALGAIFINSKQEDRAIAEYQKISQISPDNPSAYIMVGMLEDARKNYDVAADNYKKALERDPNSPIAGNNLAWLYAVTGKGNLDEAVRLAQGVVQRNPTIAGFVDTLGWVYYKKNLYGAAAEQLRKAVSLDEQVARANNSSPSAAYRYHLGMALKGNGDNAGAKRELELCVKLSEKAPFGDLDEAKKALSSL